jgi:hypothetical protein
MSGKRRKNALPDDERVIFSVRKTRAYDVRWISSKVARCRGTVETTDASSPISISISIPIPLPSLVPSMVPSPFTRAAGFLGASVTPPCTMHHGPQPLKE